MSKVHVHILKMGGTIEFFDPAYDAINKKLMRLDATIDSYFSNIIKPHFTYSVETVVEKDSRDLDEEDRKRLIRHIAAAPHDNILITHGTFTMAETAQYLAKQPLGGKKVVLTGSMIPIAGFSISDAAFNLGFAIASYIGMKPGVYISMNGGIFDSAEVEKNIEQYRFE